MRKWLFGILFSALCFSSIAVTEAFPPRWTNAAMYEWNAAGGQNMKMSSKGHTGTAWQYSVVFRTFKAATIDSARVVLYPLYGDTDSIPFTLSMPITAIEPFQMNWNLPVSDIRVQTYSSWSVVYVFVKD